MDAPTARRLNAINLAFYRGHAVDFSATRESPWPGWTRALELVRERGIAGELDVLDVGCGNGRFGAFLLAAGSPARRYTGVDASAELLERARARALPGARYERVDLVTGDPEADLPRGPYSLIALFGVLHHVPGRERRRRLLSALARRLDPRGLLFLTVWQGSCPDRQRRRIVPWEEWNRSAAEPVDPSRLEPGDCLLAWGEPRRAVRYCHFADDAEVTAQLGALPCTTVASWRADGHGGCDNRYFALAPQGTPPGATHRPGR